MKRVLLKFTILFGLTVASCDKADLSQEQNTKNDNSLIQRQSSVFNYIESTKINNDVDCENNILIFPSWDKYWETYDKLDEMIENDCDAFDATVSNNLTDDQYDALADAAGFDEDNTLIKFEEDLGFCSLRKHIETLENDWLDQQGDGVWDINSDPDNHFIEDETERALLSKKSEVIIGTKDEGYVYYKILEDFYWIEVHNNDNQAIVQVSNGIIPTNNSNVFVKDFRKELESSSASDCKTYIKEFRYHLYGSNRIKRKSKVINNSRWGYKKISALTVGYKKKNGKWRRRRTRITAGITNYYGDGYGTMYQDCRTAFNGRKIKERRRRRVKAKFAGARYDGASLIIGIKTQRVYGLHKQGGLNLTLDYYAMD